MLRFVVLLTVIGAALATEPLLADVFITDDITKLDVPEGELILLEPAQDAKGVIRYTLGNRLSGDRLVGQGSNSYTWGSPQNIQLALRYPQQGTGAVVSFVEIVTNQNSNSGRAYVADGGIGSRFILIVVEAQSVTSFSYTASIWGY